MQYGHFDDDRREYVITRPDTPRSWTNYLGSTEYGAIISNNAGGYSFFRSPADGRFLRMRYNLAPMDQPGRYFYLRDHDSGDFWSSSWQPVGKPLEEYKTSCRHGTAYTLIESEYSGIRTESTYFVPLGQRFEYWRLKVTNHREQMTRLSVFTYCEFTNTLEYRPGSVQPPVFAVYRKGDVRRRLRADGLQRQPATLGRAGRRKKTPSSAG